MTEISSLSVPQRLALDLQSARSSLKEERAQVQKLFQEIDRLNGEVDKLRGSMHRESNSRLQAEEALNITRDRLQLAVEAAGLALWEWDLTSTDVFISARWGEMIGDVAMDGYWDSRALLERCHPGDRESLQTRFMALQRGDENRAMASYRVRTTDGWLWIESHGMVAERGPEGRVLRMMGTHADIGERKRVEAAGDRARELAEQASRAKSDFLANISHEVRTPLNAIMGLIKLLMDTPLNGEQKHWLELMDTSAHTLLALLNDVLDFSRIDAGKLRLEDRPFNLKNELVGISALQQSQAAAKSIEFTHNLAPELMIEVQGDTLRLRQILINLFSNAFKFTPQRGRVEFTARLMPLEESTQRWVRIDILDTGVGIPLSQQATIFEAFTQADASTARHFGGSGLGLAICSRLVQLMGGRLELQSTPGRGSCFTVLLPFRENTPFSAAYASSSNVESVVLESDPIFVGMRVLVADDHPINEMLFSRLLQRMGCFVQHASNGEEAFAAWEIGGLDLILMDIQMPEINGSQATQRIRRIERDRGLPRTPIVAVTANAMNGDRDRYLTSGFDSYASKPIVLVELLQAMKTALEKAMENRQILAVSKKETAISDAVGLNSENSSLSTLLGNDAKARHEFIQNLVSNLRADLTMLRAGQDACSLDQVSSATHRLSSCLGLMSASRAIRLCRGIELSARSGDWALCSRAMPLLEKEVLASLSALSVQSPVAW